MRPLLAIALVPYLVGLVALGGCDKISSRTLIKEGNGLYKAGKLTEALAKFEEAAQLDESFPTLQLHLGYAAMALANGNGANGDAAYADKALKAFSRYMALKPSDSRGRKYYLQVLLDAERFDRALAFLSARHQQVPKDLEVIGALGMVSSRANRFGEALKWYEKRATLTPTDPKPLYLVGTLCWQHLHKNGGVVGVERIRIADRGLAALTNALQLKADYVEALTYSNLLYRQRALGHDDEAAKALDLQKAQALYLQALRLNQKNEPKK